MRKIIVSLPEGVVEILDKEVIGKLGEGYSDTLRTIIMNWLGEQGYLAKGEKNPFEYAKPVKQFLESMKGGKNEESKN